MKHIFVGYDPRQAVSYNVLHHSIMLAARSPVSITPLVLETLPVLRSGLTPFTYARFIPPWLCGFQGWALFLDSDELVLDDVADLFELADERYAMMVVKSSMRFEWTSVALFNCAKCLMLTPRFIEETKRLLTLDWLPEEEIGELPAEWNHLVGYDKPRADAKLVHFTQGVPCFPEVKGCEYAKEWHQVFRSMVTSEPWETIMGRSVHAAPVRERLQAANS